MTSFVSADDFELQPYSIPNLYATNAFEEYVAEEQEKVLRDEAMGLLLYEAFKAAVEASIAQTPTPLEDRWQKLIDGDTYVYATKTYKWNGLKDLLKPYIYHKWVTDTYDTLTGTGVVEDNNENSKRKSPAERIVYAYNEYVDKVGYTQNNWTVDIELYQNTLFGYLYAKGDDFLDIIQPEFSTMITYLFHNYKFPEKMNTFNI